MHCRQLELKLNDLRLQLPLSCNSPRHLRKASQLALWHRLPMTTSWILTQSTSCRLLGKSRDTLTKAFKRTIPGSGIDPRVNAERAGSRETKVAKMPDNLCTEMATGCKSTEHWVKVWAVKYKGDWGNHEMTERDIRRDIVDDYDEDDWYTPGMMEKHFNDKNAALTYKAVLEKNPALTP